MLPNPFKRAKPAPIFTGNCLVRLHTGDGHGVGPCWHSTYDGVCPSHGDVGMYLQVCSEHEVDIWPNDYQLPQYDDNPWAERLRTRQANYKRGNES